MIKWTLFNAITSQKAFGFGALKQVTFVVGGCICIMALSLALLSCLYSRMSGTDQQIRMEQIERRASDRATQSTLTDIQTTIANHTAVIADVDVKVEKAVTLIGRLDRKLDQLTATSRPTSQPVWAVHN